MRAMVMAAGLGTRLRPITWEIPKPVVPVCNLPIVEHLVRLCARHDIGEIASNLHWFPETIEGRLGDGSKHGVEMTYIYEEELRGTAGGVRGAKDFLCADDEPFLVLAGDALTDIDLKRLAEAHAANDGVATLAVKQVHDVSQYGVVVTGSDGRVQGFQEKPDPAEALSDLVNTMVYVLSPEIFDYFPDQDPVDFALDVFPRLLENDVPFYVHEIDAYWNDIGTLPEYINGNLDALTGKVRVDMVVGEAHYQESPLEDTQVPDDLELEGPVLFGPGCEVGAGASVVGPLVIGANAKIGAGARVKQSVLLPGAQVPAGSVVARGVFGDAEAIASSNW